MSVLAFQVPQLNFVVVTVRYINYTVLTRKLRRTATANGN